MAALLSLATSFPNQELYCGSAYQWINLGTLILNGDSVAWFSGHPKSDYTVIGPNNVNPCTRTFDLKVDAGGTTGTYQEFGCGGPSTDFGSTRMEYSTRNAPLSLSQMPTAFILPGTALKFASLWELST
ncbi:hypothetical protein B0H13DRAFT_2322977 [Mycena leptocephala]|nr:hypothetical protein B0H13DRAFT_2322977 [Mycena leptocephala]